MFQKTLTEINNKRKLIEIFMETMETLQILSGVFY